MVSLLWKKKSPYYSVVSRIILTQNFYKYLQPKASERNVFHGADTQSRRLIVSVLSMEVI